MELLPNLLSQNGCWQKIFAFVVVLSRFILAADSCDRHDGAVSKSTKPESGVKSVPLVKQQILSKNDDQQTSSDKENTRKICSNPSIEITPSTKQFSNFRVKTSNNSEREVIVATSESGIDVQKKLQDFVIKHPRRFQKILSKPAKSKSTGHGKNYDIQSVIRNEQNENPLLLEADANLIKHLNTETDSEPDSEDEEIEVIQPKTEITDSNEKLKDTFLDEDGLVKDEITEVVPEHENLNQISDNVQSKLGKTTSTYDFDIHSKINAKALSDDLCNFDEQFEPEFEKTENRLNSKTSPKNTTETSQIFSDCELNYMMTESSVESTNVDQNDQAVTSNTNLGSENTEHVEISFEKQDEPLEDKNLVNNTENIATSNNPESQNQTDSSIKNFHNVPKMTVSDELVEVQLQMTTNFNLSDSEDDSQLIEEESKQLVDQQSLSADLNSKISALTIETTQSDANHDLEPKSPIDITTKPNATEPTISINLNEVIGALLPTNKNKNIKTTQSDANHDLEHTSPIDIKTTPNATSSNDPTTPMKLYEAIKALLSTNKEFQKSKDLQTGVVLIEKCFSVIKLYNSVLSMFLKSKNFNEALSNLNNKSTESEIEIRSNPSPETKVDKTTETSDKTSQANSNDKVFYIIECKDSRTSNKLRKILTSKNVKQKNRKIRLYSTIPFDSESPLSENDD